MVEKKVLVGCINVAIENGLLITFRDSMVHVLKYVKQVLYYVSVSQFKWFLTVFEANSINVRFNYLTRQSKALSNYCVPNS